MKTMKNFLKVLNNPQWIWVTCILAIIAFLLLYISEAQLPNLPLSSGIVAFISAVIGVLLTAFAISVQLKQQSEGETQKDKDIKIYEKKIHVYSEFTEKMWGMFDDGHITDDELKELRTICFRRLVFHLEKEQIIEIADEIEGIRDNSMRTAGKITNILRRGLESKNSKKEENDISSNLIRLFNIFDQKESSENKSELIEANNENVIQQPQTEKNIQFWHFNMLDNQQLEAFKKGNWVLSLIEYGENWRTNFVKQVSPDDVIFLFKRGGSGYIGAFKALNPSYKIIYADKTYSKEDYDKYDIYDGISDGASLVSNIIVEPIAYNFKGVGCYSVRRSTIQRMNDMEAVKFLLNRFNGKELDEERLSGNGKLDINIPVKLNENYFSEIIKKYK